MAGSCMAVRFIQLRGMVIFSTIILQGSVATYLRFGGIPVFNYYFARTYCYKSGGEIIFRTGYHLAKLEAKVV